MSDRPPGATATESHFSRKHPVAPADPPKAAACVAKASGLSVGLVKDAMGKGAVWVVRKGGVRHRLRRVTATVRPGDVLEIHYDRGLLALAPPVLRMLRDEGSWSGWVKPAGILSQGTLFGDHLSFLRIVELRLARPAFLVHRLDREVEGVMVVAHDEKAAAGLSEIFREGRLVKRYRAEVAGNLAAEHGTEGVVDTPLDGKSARTLWRCTGFDAERESTSLDLVIETGRHHQIRRHLEGLGHPVLGDPRYGVGNRAPEGLRLRAVALSFRDPLSGADVDLRLEEV